MEVWKVSHDPEACGLKSVQQMPKALWLEFDVELKSQHFQNTMVVSSSKALNPQLSVALNKHTNQMR